MRIYLLFSLPLLTLACGTSRPLGTSDRGGLGSDSGQMTEAQPTANLCPYPEGVCDFNADCPAGHHCEGAMHTTDVPHAFICRGICVPEESPGSCEPNAEPPLSVSLVERGSQVVAVLYNRSCAPIYRWVDACCHGMGPRVDVQREDGSWQTGACADVEPGCCDEPPYCEILRPGEVREVAIPELSACRCVDERFRVFARFFESAECVDLDDGPPLGAISNTYEPLCP